MLNAILIQGYQEWSRNVTAQETNVWLVARKSKATTAARYDRTVQALAQHREKAGYSQRALSAKLGKHAATVGKIERGERALTLLDFYSICAALELSPLEVIRASVSD